MSSSPSEPAPAERDRLVGLELELAASRAWVKLLEKDIRSLNDSIALLRADLERSGGEQERLRDQVARLEATLARVPPPVRAVLRRWINRGR